MSLTEIAPSQLPFLLPLFEPLDFNLALQSMMAGNTPARAFVDNPNDPAAAALWDRQDALFIAGDPYREAHYRRLRGLLRETILPDARQRGIPELAIFSTIENWAGMFVGLDHQKALRYSYAFRGPLPAWRMMLPEGYRVQRIDESLLGATLGNIDQVRGWIDSFWRSPQAFLHTGFGWCAVQGESIAAWCLTVFSAGTRRELGLATVPEHRNRGLAVITAAACVEHALQNQFTPEWHCWADNLPSVAVAEKIGFQRVRDYSVIRLKTTELAG